MSTRTKIIGTGVAAAVLATVGVVIARRSR